MSKKWLVLLLTAAMMIMSISYATAEEFSYANGTYTYIINNGSVTITGWTGTDTEIVIPDEIDNKPVTAIGDSAFRDKTALNNITIPDSITTIGKLAFANCTGLGSITIPDSVKVIGVSAFEDCINMTSVELSENVTTLEKAAFRNCGLKSITIPDSVTFIGSTAFEDCINMTSVKLSKNITSIEDATFRICGLKSIEIPDGVTKIGVRAFDECADLASAIVPASVTEIGEEAFKEYYGHTTLLVKENSFAMNYADQRMPYRLYYGEEYDGGNGYRYAVENGSAVITAYTGSATNLEIPSVIKGYTVTTIGDSVFRDNLNLSSVTIPDSVTTIDRRAFTNCMGLSSITIPDSVTFIGPVAFEDCSNMTSIKLSKNITSIENWTFAYCGLTSITIPDGVTKIGDRVFVECENLTSVTIPDSVTAIGYRTFPGCRKLSELFLPDNIDSIGNDLFMSTPVTLYADSSTITGETLTNAGYTYVDTYTGETYTIRYKLAGGKLPEGTSNPEIYTAKDEFTLVNPTKNNHVFWGWTGTDLDEITKTVTIPKRSKGNREYTAEYILSTKLEMKAEINENFSDEDVKNTDLGKTEFDTVEKIEKELVLQVTQKSTSSDGDAIETVLYDVTLLYKEADGTWTRADAEHFPPNGKLSVSLEVPAGTSPQTHSYTVAHMFSMNRFGKKAGDVEFPACTTRYKDGKWYLDFEVTGLSPILIAAQKVLPVNLPQTGDTANIAFYMMLIAFSTVSLMVMKKNHRIE